MFKSYPRLSFFISFKLFKILPSGKTISNPKTKSLVIPYFSTFEPPALEAILPPIVQLSWKVSLKESTYYYLQNFFMFIKVHQLEQ